MTVDAHDHAKGGTRHSPRRTPKWVVVTVDDGAAAGGGSTASFGVLLRAHRQVALLSQEELADLAQVSVRTIRDLERDRVRTPRGKSVRLLVDALGLQGARREELERAARREPSRHLAGITGDPGHRRDLTTRALTLDARERSHEPAAGAPGTDLDARADGTPGRAPGLREPLPLERRGDVARVAAAAVAGDALPLMVPQQLPPAVAGFTGRQEELARLDGLLDADGQEPGTVAIGAVSGTAGVGKTALAVHWAHRVRGRFPDGVLYVNLRGFDPVGVPAAPAAVLDGFLRALGVPPGVIPPALDDRAALLRTKLTGRRVLLVLDNAASSAQAEWLLPASPGCVVVVTSRGRLSGLVARGGAQRMLVDVLPEAEALALLRLVVGADRVDAEPAAAGTLARLCAGLPLALRLAAERATASPHRALEDLAGDLADEYGRLDLLAADDDDDVAAVRAAFSWSYRALTPAAARAFRLLGLHPGPDISLAAAAALTGVGHPEARRLMADLTGVHLLQESAHGRYRFHDLLRVYASDRAQADEPADERDAAVDRVLEWYLRTADVADRLLMPRRRHVPLPPPGPADQPLRLGSTGAALGWCEAERANMVAATGHAAETGREALAWRLAYSMWSYFVVRKYWADWIDTNQVGLAAAQLCGDRPGQALVLTSLANAYRDVGRFDAALDRFEQAIAVSDEIGEPWIEAAALTLRSITLRDLRRFDEARHGCQRALELFESVGDPWGKSWALYTLGEICEDLRCHDEAIGYSRQALVMFRAAEDRLGEGSTLSLLAQIHRNTGQLEQATGHCRRALDVARGIGYRQGEALALYTLGKIQHDTGQLDAAQVSWRQALATFTALGAPQAGKVRARLQQLLTVTCLGL